MFQAMAQSGFLALATTFIPMETVVTSNKDKEEAMEVDVRISKKKKSMKK